MNRIELKLKRRGRRAQRRRSKIVGFPERPRLSVFRSLKHIYAHLIDDIAGRTLCTISSEHKDVIESLGGKKSKTDIAKAVGARMGVKTRELGIQRVYFDNGPYKYHGRVKALAEGFLQSGIRF